MSAPAANCSHLFSFHWPVWTNGNHFNWKYLGGYTGFPTPAKWSAVNNCQGICKQEVLLPQGKQTCSAIPSQFGTDIPLSKPNLFHALLLRNLIDLWNQAKYVCLWYIPDYQEEYSFRFGHWYSRVNLANEYKKICMLLRKSSQTIYLARGAWIKWHRNNKSDVNNRFWRGGRRE